MQQTFFHLLRADRRGISMLEAALALGVFGLIVAAIWIMTGSVFGTSKKNQLAQQVVASVEGIRNYTRHADLSNLTLTNEGLWEIGALPNDVRRGGELRNAYGGSFDVRANKTSIAIILTKIPSDACADLLYARLGGSVEAGNNMAFAGYVPGIFTSMGNLRTDTSFDAVTSFCRSNRNFSVAFRP